MPRKLLRQTANVVARETALVVFTILGILVYQRYRQVMEDAERPNPSPKTYCTYPQFGLQQCQAGKDFETQ